MGLAAGELEQCHRSEREADRVDGISREPVGHRRREVRVRLGVVRLVVRAVTEQVDSDHRAARVGEEGLPSGLLPCADVASAPSVHHDDRLVAHGSYPALCPSASASPRRASSTPMSWSGASRPAAALAASTRTPRTPRSRCASTSPRRPRSGLGSEHASSSDWVPWCASPHPTGARKPRTASSRSTG